MSVDVNKVKDEWWGFSSEYGWVVLDRKIDSNRPGKSDRLLFLMCDGWVRYEEDRARWEPPYYYFSERYIENLSEKEALEAQTHLNNLKEEYRRVQKMNTCQSFKNDIDNLWRSQVE